MYYSPPSNPVALFTYKITFWSANYSACVVYILKKIIHLSGGDKCWIFIEPRGAM